MWANGVAQLKCVAIAMEDGPRGTSLSHNHDLFRFDMGIHGPSRVVFMSFLLQKSY